MKKSKEEKVVKTSLNSTLLFSDDKKKRFRLHIEWDKDKPVATVIMLSPSKATGILFDKTTNNVLSNLSRLDYGSVYIVNLFAELQEKVRFSDKDDLENLQIISNVVDIADKVIFAVGTGHQSNKAVQKRQKSVVEILVKSFQKCYCIADEYGQMFYHPLCPKVATWNLVELPFKQLCKELGIKC